MMEQQLKQRIAYLVEHGGIVDDPLDELHRKVRVLTWMVSVALTLDVAQLLARLMV
jgi:hypothetical protein